MSLTDAEAARLLATEEGRLLQEAVRSVLRVERFRNGRVREVRSLMSQVADALRAAVRGRLEGTASRGARGMATRNVRLIEQRVQEILRGSTARILDLLAPALREMALREGASVGVLGARALGTTLRQQLGAWASAATRDARGAVGAGVMEGEEVSQIMGRLDSALSRASSQVSSLARTFSDAVAAQSRERDIERAGYSMVRYVAILDDVTTTICEDLNGTVWPLYEGPRPPQHHGCRSGVAAATSEEPDFGEITQAQLEEAA